MQICRCLLSSISNCHSISEIIFIPLIPGDRFLHKSWFPIGSPRVSAGKFCGWSIMSDAQMVYHWQGVSNFEECERISKKRRQLLWSREKIASRRILVRTMLSRLTSRTDLIQMKYLSQILKPNHPVISHQNEISKFIKSNFKFKFKFISPPTFLNYSSFNRICLLYRYEYDSG
jgi:hypothetical protein